MLVNEMEFVDAIYKYSEIDLQYVECGEIIHSLIGLVETKSFSKLISELGENELDDSVGIGISDLLDILSISASSAKSVGHWRRRQVPKCMI